MQIHTVADLKRNCKVGAQFVTFLDLILWDLGTSKKKILTGFNESIFFNTPLRQIFTFSFILFLFLSRHQITSLLIYGFRYKHNIIKIWPESDCQCNKIICNTKQKIKQSTSSTVILYEQDLRHSLRYKTKASTNTTLLARETVINYVQIWTSKKDIRLTKQLTVFIS